MRKLALLACAALLVGCGGDDSPTGNNGGAGLSATIDGTQFNASLAVQAIKTTTGGVNVIQISGSNATGSQIMLQIMNATGPGTYPIGAGSQSGATYTEGGTKTWVSSLVGGSGSVTFTELTTTKAVGTFTFTGIGSGTTQGTTKTVTNGSFNVTFNLSF